MREKFKKNLKKQAIRFSRTLLLSQITLLILSFLIFSFFISLFYKNRVVNNTYIGKVNLGGLKNPDSKIVLDQILNDYKNQNISFTYKDKVIEAKVRDLGVDFDQDATFGKLHFWGHPRNFFADLIFLVSSFFNSSAIQPDYIFDAVRFNKFIDAEFSTFEKQPESAKFINNRGRISVLDSKEGQILNRASAASEFANRLDSLSQVPIELESMEAKPQFNTSELNSISEEYGSLLNKKIILTWEYDSWMIDSEDLISVVKIGRMGYVNDYFLSIQNGNLPIYLKNVKFSGLDTADVEISVDEDALSPFLNKISKVIDRPTINATAKFDGKRITEFTQAIDGQKLDVDKVKSQIFSYISEGEDQKSGLTIKLPVTTTTANFANDQINSLGIKELIGKGISYFSGSIVNRIYNIELAASRINGTLIAPGETFSFNNKVGEVSAKTGYKQAYVISSGRTVLDDGGGICQVSTTIFRAAINSGLPIISRTAHAYRVGYYEQRGFGPGLDATVFAPSVDFQFKNDTSNHILIQTIFSRSNALLEVDIYGTRDGRSVEIDKPVILNRSPAPPEIRQEEPSLPKGVIKQVDFAAEGADVFFKRKVFRNSEILHEDTFKSRFKPWQAVFLVGTGG